MTLRPFFDTIWGIKKQLFAEFSVFLSSFISYLRRWGRRFFTNFESIKGILVVSLYKQRGKFARPFLHSSMGILSATSIMLAPVIAQELPGALSPDDQWGRVPVVLSANTENPQTATIVSDKPRDRIIGHPVQFGETVSTIAEKYGITSDTIRWQNKLTSDKLTEGQVIQIVPVTGVAHKVAPGDTIYSIAKKYNAEPQAIVDFPFNTFSNDETFELAVGQIVVVPDGVPPKEVPVSPYAKRRTPDAGTLVAAGVFAWPTSGEITQRFSWYHRGMDVANKVAPDVLAADSGQVIYAGCVPGGYGCHVIIDHKNGSQTLYAHLQKIYVSTAPGENGAVRGKPIGKMGSTGRSTGTHLHFEIMQNGAKLDPLRVLQ